MTEIYKLLRMYFSTYPENLAETFSTQFIYNQKTSIMLFVEG